MHTLFLLCAVFHCIHVDDASAQLYTLSGANAQDRFGAAIVVLGDLNTDGFDDFAVSLPRAGSSPGQVRVHSGLTGTLLYTVAGSANNDHFGLSIARMPDIDADGKADFAVGAPSISGSGSSGYVRIVSGGSGTTIATLTPPNNTSSYVFFGASVASAGDVNGDGYVDLIVGAPDTIDSTCGGTSPAGAIYVFSGASGRPVLYTKLGGKRALGCCGASCPTDSPWQFGRSAISLGDVNSDGSPDFASVTNSKYGFIQAFSGATGNVLYTLVFPSGNTLPEFPLSFGNVLLGFEDSNRDGIRDFIVGVPHDGSNNGGYVEIRNGANGGVIRRLDSAGAGELFGSSLASMGDIDGDSISEILIGAAHNPSVGSGYGYVIAISGLTSNQLFKIVSPRPDISFGQSVASLPDLNSDGTREIIIGAPFDDIGGTDTGSVFVHGGTVGGASFRMIKGSTVTIF